MDIELAQALTENELLKSLLYCTKRSCNNCGKGKEEEEYYKAMEEEYYKDMEEQEERLRQELIQNYDFERGDVKY